MLRWPISVSYLRYHRNLNLDSVPSGRIAVSWGKPKGNSHRYPVAGGWGLISKYSSSNFVEEAPVTGRGLHF